MWMRFSNGVNSPWWQQFSGANVIHSRRATSCDEAAIMAEDSPIAIKHPNIMNIIIILLILLLLGGGGYGFRSGNHFLGGGASLLVIILLILLLTGRL